MPSKALEPFSEFQDSLDIAELRPCLEIFFVCRDYIL